jgi:uridylate kinase
MSENPKYKRVLLKLSGEALAGDKDFGVSIETLERIAEEICSVRNKAIEIAIVVGGGNIFRGVKGAAAGMDRATADNVGMLATLINSIILQDALIRTGADVFVMSAIDVGRMVEPFVRTRAISLLEQGKILIFAAGTGHPYFTTDTAAALRALEINANCLMKATNVDGIYDKDPRKFQDAKKIKEITYQEVLEKGLKVMDAASISLAKDACLPVFVFNLNIKGNIQKALTGEDIGSLVL